MTRGNVRHCYSVMDAAYDAKEIKDFIRQHRLVPIIDSNPRNNKKYIPLDPAKQERYKIRTTVERAYSQFKDNLITRKLYGKGASKVSFILMLAIVSLASQKYFQYFNPIIS